MKIFELLETAKETGDIITRKNCCPGCVKNIRYFNQYKEFMAVKESGDLVLPDNLPRRRVNLSVDLMGDDFYLIPYKTEDKTYKTEAQRLYDLIKKHIVTIDDLETIVEIYDHGIFTGGIVKAVLRAYPYSFYASEMAYKKADQEKIDSWI